MARMSPTSRKGFVRIWQKKKHPSFNRLVFNRAEVCKTIVYHMLLIAKPFLLIMKFLRETLYGAGPRSWGAGGVKVNLKQPRSG